MAKPRRSKNPSTPLTESPSTTTSPKQKQKGANAHSPLRTPFFPLAQYTSLVGVQTTLLAFTALFLPRTPVLLELSSTHYDPDQQTSRDRPQHLFLEALTLSPVVTVSCWCVGALVLQIWWGEWVRGWFIDYKRSGKGFVREEKANTSEGESRKVKTKAIASALFSTWISSLVLHLVLVLFGAPITSHVPQTYLLAFLLSILTVYSTTLTFGPLNPLSNESRDVVNQMTWVRLFAEFSMSTPIDRALVYPTVGTFLGCWAGAIPIALDWDRPWQAWPLTPAFGAILGYILASLLAVVDNSVRYLAGWR